jgi:uncharacterized protein YjbI with pentapeptide repeats
MTEMPRPRNSFRLDVHGAYLRGTEFKNVTLEDANLEGADFTNAKFRGSNFRNANLKGTILRGADLTGVTNLTRPQIAEAIIDEHTKLPALAPDPASAK